LSARRSRGPASSTSGSHPRWYADALGEMLEQARTGAARLRSQRRCRSRWSPRTRLARSPSPRPGTAPSATRSRGCSSSPARGRARVLLQRRRRADGELPRSVEATRRGRSPRGRLRAVRRDLARNTGRPRPAMLEQIEASLERFRIHFDSWGCRASSRAIGEFCPARHVREGRRVWARSQAYGDDEDDASDPLAERGGTRPTGPADVRPTSSTKLERGFDRRDLRARADPPRHAPAGTRRSRACSVTTPTGSRCRSTSSST
jgi:hypothetical protein